MTAIVLFLVLIASEVKPPLTIYVFTRTDASGFLDAAQQRRLDSVRDLRDVLDRGLKRFEPVLVDNREEAHVVIEVLSSAREETGEYTEDDPSTDFSQREAITRPVIRARVSLEGYSTDIANVPRGHTWKTAARQWQRQFRRWADDQVLRLAKLTATR